MASPTTSSTKCKSSRSKTKPTHRNPITRKISNPIAIASYSVDNCSYDYSSSTDSFSDGDMIGVGFTGAKSLPPPRAPYLCSKGIARDRFSKMTKLQLPESAAPSPSTASTSYGSLRDSLFFYHDNRMTTTESSSSNTYSFSNFCPQSLPTHMMNTGRHFLNVEEWENNTSASPACDKSTIKEDIDNQIMHQNRITNNDSDADEEQILSSSLSTALQLMETSRSSNDGNNVASSLNVSISQNDRDRINKSLDNRKYSSSCRAESPVLDHEFLLNNETTSYDEEGCVDETHNNNPDTFEAFDLEL